MAFEKYQVTNNAYGNLLAGIGASDISVQLGSAEGDRFPDSGQAIGTLVQYDIASDPTSDIVKQESVLITNKSGDVFTITRGFGGDTATGFNAGDWLYVNVRAEIIDDVYDELDRLESEKANDNVVVKTTGNQTVAGNKSFTGTTATKAINADGTVTATDFVGDGSGLTNVISDISGNIASDAQAIAGNATDVVITPAQSNLLNTYITASSLSTSNVTFTKVVTHGLGRIPTEIEFDIAETGLSWSKGHYKSGNYGYISLFSSNISVNGTAAIGRIYTNVTTRYFDITITSITSTQITFTFTATGTPNAGEVFHYLTKIR